MANYEKTNIITCLTWIAKGIANPNPQKIDLSTEELEKIVNKDKASLKKNDKSVKDTEMRDRHLRIRRDYIDEYNFDEYDEEPDDVHCHIADIVSFEKDGKDPLITNDDDDDDDSEKENDTIKDTDNLLLVGHVEYGASTLEVYIYNELEGSFYCHHDILLSSFPLCIRWLNFDPSDPKPSNLCAIGNMDGDIEVWDVDLINALEPNYKIDCKPKKKTKLRQKNNENFNAILDVDWNKEFKHLLASGGVDNEVKVWDLETGVTTHTFDNFNDRVQTLQWNSAIPRYLVAGSADKGVYILNGVTGEVVKTWKVQGEVEKVIWQPNTSYCMCATDRGMVYSLDMRTDKPEWEFHACTNEVAGIAYSSASAGIFAAAGSDGYLRIFDIKKERKEVYTENCNVGPIICLEANPDNPFTFAVGGTHKSHNIKVYDVSTAKKVDEAFGNRYFAQKRT